MSRWHLEAGIACEHAVAASVRETDRDRIVGCYDLLMARSPGPIVALNRAVAVAERHGVEEGRRKLIAVAGEKKLARYALYGAALADLQRPAGRHGEARSSYSAPLSCPEAGRTGLLPAALGPSRNVVAPRPVPARRVRLPGVAHTADAPWYAVEADDKRRARINMIAHLLSTIPITRCTARRSSCRPDPRRRPTSARVRAVPVSSRSRRRARLDVLPDGAELRNHGCAMVRARPGAPPRRWRVGERR